MNQQFSSVKTLENFQKALAVNIINIEVLE